MPSESATASPVAALAPTPWRIRPEAVVVPLALLLFGGASAVITPPGQTPDENANFYRAYDVAAGHLRPAKVIGGWGGSDFPANVVATIDATGPITAHPDQKFSVARYRELASNADGGELVAKTYPSASAYTFVPVLPQATGIRLAQVAGLAPLGQFLAGRFANLVWGAGLLALALTLTPIGARYLSLLALLPMSVHLFGSYGPDVSTFGAALLVVVLALRLALADGRRASWWEVGGLLLTTAWLAVCKPPYLPIALVLLGIPAARFGGGRRFALVLAAAGLVGAAAAGWAMAATKPYYPDPKPVGDYQTSIREQARFVARHPGQFAASCLRFHDEGGRSLAESFYTLGWLDTPLSPLLTVLQLTVLGILATSDRARAPAGLARLRWAAAAAAVAAWASVLLSMYLWWSPIGYRSVGGIQGRYLLPLLPLGLIFAPAAVLRVAMTLRAAWTLAGWTAAVGMAVGGAALVSRFYLAETPLWMTGGAIVLAGLVAGGTVYWALEWRHAVTGRRGDVTAEQMVLRLPGTRGAA